mmetsp:Transcript_89794/g.254344  ORF Transcript_89794/g.254344 Transcript_89794/m.254344 type:complete len:291 (+) Transcript_89794:2745-3617(+)
MALDKCGMLDVGLPATVPPDVRLGIVEAAQIRPIVVVVPTPERNVGRIVDALHQWADVGRARFDPVGLVERHAPDSALDAPSPCVRGKKLPVAWDVLVMQRTLVFVLALLHQHQPLVRPLDQVVCRRHHRDAIPAIGKGAARPSAVRGQQPAGEYHIPLAGGDVCVRQRICAQDHKLAKLHAHHIRLRLIIERPQGQAATLGGQAQDKHQPVPPKYVDPLGGLGLGELTRLVAAELVCQVQEAYGPLATIKAKVWQQEVIDLNSHIREEPVQFLERLRIQALGGIQRGHL